MNTPVFAPAFPAAGNLLGFLFTPAAVHVIFFIALALYALASLVLLYHWLRYNVGFIRTVVVIAVYFSGSIILLSASYSASLFF